MAEELRKPSLVYIHNILAYQNFFPFFLLFYYYVFWSVHPKNKAEPKLTDCWRLSRWFSGIQINNTSSRHNYLLIVLAFTDCVRCSWTDGSRGWNHETPWSHNRVIQNLSVYLDDYTSVLFFFLGRVIDDYKGDRVRDLYVQPIHVSTLTFIFFFA